MHRPKAELQSKSKAMVPLFCKKAIREDDPITINYKTHLTHEIVSCLHLAKVDGVSVSWLNFNLCAVLAVEIQTSFDQTSDALDIECQLGVANQTGNVEIETRLGGGREDNSDVCASILFDGPFPWKQVDHWLRP